MPIDTAGRANWFDRDGRNYALFRPEYPPALAAHLAAIAPGTGRALDVGCGTGQLTLQLARHFDQVIGLDPSRAQVENAAPHPRVTYVCAPAEEIPLNDGSADLIAAAQAAHWFDRPAFYPQARRLAAPGAVIALISYGVLRLDDPSLNERFARFYHHEIGPFWPPERRLVDSGYKDMDFPFETLPAPALSISRDWGVDEFLGYVLTWSAVRRAREAGRSDIFDAFARDVAALWPRPDRLCRVSWPIAMRIGRL